jgi:2-hydroxychromene-2-carboxylate isomerase
MLQHFGEDLNVNDEPNIEAILLALNLPAADIIATAQSEPLKLALRRQTERAYALGVFGGPTFFAGDQMFWGNDRLEDALRHAALR